VAGPCPFCRIVAGEAPAFVVLEDDCCTAFLDTKPLFPGPHLAGAARAHETLVDLPASMVAPLFETAQRIAAAVEAALGAAGTFVAMNNRVSQSVPHLHVHVVPRNRKDGLRGFFWPRQAYDGDAHAAEVAASLRAALG
jgi:histidine triad (HIT) family protein